MTEEINDPIAALRTELASVAPSPGFAERVRERIADELEPLRAELGELTVSPEFAVRVRQGIEAAGGRTRFSWSPFNWRFAVPAAGLGAAALAALMLLKPADNSAPTQVAAAQPALQTPVPAPAPPAPTDVPQVARNQERPAPVASRVAPVATQAQPSSREPRDPMLEVITDQPALLRALSVRVAPGVAVDATEPASLYQAPALEVAPIEVSPISKFVVPDTRAPIGVTPFILRITAESAERSSR